MQQPWQTGRVLRIEEATPTTRRYWIQAIHLETFDFKPGQFVTLDLPIDERPGKRWRSYSIASWPDGSNIFELVIVLLEGGRGTHYLFNEVSVGSELVFRGPLGNFTLPEPIDKNLFFICTGTGIAPFRSMIHYIYTRQVMHQRLFLIFGCRRTSDCLYGAEFRLLEKELPRFRYIPTFSQEHTNSDPLVRKGYVHTIYEEIIAELSGLQPAHFFLCGWKNMIDEAKARILAMGYTKQDVHLELYG